MPFLKEERILFPHKVTLKNKQAIKIQDYQLFNWIIVKQKVEEIIETEESQK